MFLTIRVLFEFMIGKPCLSPKSHRDISLVFSMFKICISRLSDLCILMSVYSLIKADLFPFNLSMGRSESGTYYSLDLGGTNFRVLRVQLRGRRSSTIGHDVERQPIPLELMTCTSEVIFF